MVRLLNQICSNIELTFHLVAPTFMSDMLVRSSQIDGYLHPALCPRSTDYNDRLEINPQSRKIIHAPNPYNRGEWMLVKFQTTDRLTDLFVITVRKRNKIRSDMNAARIELDPLLSIEDVLAFVFFSIHVDRKAAVTPTINAKQRMIALLENIPSLMIRNALYKDVKRSSRLYKIIYASLTDAADGMPMIWIETKAKMLAMGPKRNRVRANQNRTIVKETKNAVEKALHMSAVPTLALVGTFDGYNQLKRLHRKFATPLKYKISLPQLVCSPYNSLFFSLPPHDQLFHKSYVCACSIFLFTHTHTPAVRAMNERRFFLLAVLGRA